jgi:hypothetical protein
MPAARRHKSPTSGPYLITPSDRAQSALSANSRRSARWFLAVRPLVAAERFIMWTQSVAGGACMATPVIDSVRAHLMVMPA